MAFAFVAQGGFGSKTSESSTTGTPSGTGTLAAGGLVVVSIGMDNVIPGVTGGTESNSINSVTDSAGNVYTKAVEYTGGSSTLGATTTSALYYSVITSPVTLGSTTWTASFVANCTAKALLVQLFTLSGGVGVTGTGNNGANLATVSGLDTAKLYCFVGAEGVESPTTSVFTLNGSTGGEWPNPTFGPYGTTGGKTDTNINHFGGYVIESGKTTKSLDKSATNTLPKTRVLAAFWETEVTPPVTNGTWYIL